MSRLRLEKWLIGAALAAAATVSVQAAQAADAPAGSTGGDASSVKPAGADAKDATPAKDATDATPATDAKDAKKDDKAEEDIFRIGIDMVIGSAKTSAVNGVIPPGTTAGGLTGVTNITTGRVTSYSFLVDGSVKVTSGFGLGLRMPLEGGTLFANPTRSDGGIGSLELSAAGMLNLSQGLDLELSLGLSLPTAQGRQIPATADQVAVTQGSIDQSNYDRFTVQRAISMSRGYEDDELFQPNHFGINPKIRLIAGTAGKWHVDPWIKLDNLIATNTSYSFIDELLLGVNFGVFLCPQFEAALRAWLNVPITGADFTSAVAVVEPQLRFKFGPVSPYLGAILPIAGPIANPYAYGIRVGISAKF